jgi:hypothetical protein
MLMTYLPDGGYVLPADEEKKRHEPLLFFVV